MKRTTEQKEQLKQKIIESVKTMTRKTQCLNIKGAGIAQIANMSGCDISSAQYYLAKMVNDGEIIFNGIYYEKH